MRRSNKQSRRLFIVLAAAVLILFACTVCTLWVTTTSSRPSGVEQTEAPDGDCDTGDLYESKPDPDCGGRWYGTPAPAVKKTPTQAPARKTPGPRRTR